MHFSDSSGHIIGLCKKGSNEIVLINPGKELRVKRMLVQKYMFHHFFNPNTKQSIPMKVVLEDGRPDKGDIVYIME